MKKFLKVIVLNVLLILLMFFCLFSVEIASVFIETAALCVKSVIPSLLPVTVVSLMILKFNLIEIFPDRIKFFVLFIISNLSGYPVGSKLLDSYCQSKRISCDNAARLLPAFVNAGPGFIINTIGMGVFASKNIGVALFLSQFSASFLIFLILGGLLQKTGKSSSFVNISKSFTGAVAESIDAIKNVCVYLILCSCVAQIVKIMFGTKAAYILVCATEITSAVFSQNSIYAVCILLSYCGICVYFQIFSVVDNFKINFLRLILWRAFHIICSIVFLKIYIKIFKISIPVFSNTMESLTLSNNIGLYYFIFLVFTLICFMSSIKRKSSGNLAKDLI